MFLVDSYTVWDRVLDLYIRREHSMSCDKKHYGATGYGGDCSLVIVLCEIKRLDRPSSWSSSDEDDHVDEKRHSGRNKFLNVNYVFRYTEYTVFTNIRRFETSRPPNALDFIHVVRIYVFSPTGFVIHGVYNLRFLNR